MGYQSQLIFSKCSVSFVLLFLLSACLVQAQCPNKCECSADGLKIRCNNENLVLLPQGPFHRKLQIMDLSFNRIGILKPSIFADRQIYSLVNLTMSNNTITVLDEPFRGLSALTYLDLSNNDIDKFKATIFDDVQHLKTLVLHHNPYLELAETGYDLPELTDLILNNCRIKTIPSAYFNKLKSLENVYLSENFIEHFDSKVLLGDLNNLKTIDLRSNWLYHLGEVVDHLPASIKDFKISSNPWSCSCDIKEAFALYETGNYEITPLVCSSPEDLKNLSLTAELIKLITCTTTTEETTSASTTVVTSVQDVREQSDQSRVSDIETISNISNSEKSGRIITSQDDALSRQVLDKKADYTSVASAGWLDNWMIYSAIALVVTTSIVVFFVKYQVTKHMERNGNDLARNNADFEMSLDGYCTVNSKENVSRGTV